MWPSVIGWGVARKETSKTKTADREKIALWLDRPSLDTLREIQHEIGVPVSEQIRRAVTAYLEKDSGRLKKSAK
jgi:hypothetical protein